LTFPPVLFFRTKHRKEREKQAVTICPPALAALARTEEREKRERKEGEGPIVYAGFNKTTTPWIGLKGREEKEEILRKKKKEGKNFHHKLRLQPEERNTKKKENGRKKRPASISFLILLE